MLTITCDTCCKFVGMAKNTLLVDKDLELGSLGDFKNVKF